MRKTFLYKVYDSNSNYIKTWSDVVSSLSFDWNINSGFGETTVRLQRYFDSFGEEDDVALNNEVQVYCIDGDNSSGSIIYSGYISGYAPVLDGANEYVDVTLLGYTSTLEDDILKNGSNTIVTYNSYDPSNIISDIFTKYDNKITTGVINLTGTTISYIFNTSTFLQAIRKIRELAPSGWYFYIDAQNKLHFKKKNTVADHTLIIGKHLTSVKPEKRLENVKNVVLFVGNGVYKEYVRAGSITDYGRRVEVIQDKRVTQEATADIMADTFLDDHETVEIRTNVRVIDNNIISNGLGYNIETIKPGDTVQIKGFGSNYPESLWDVGIWNVTAWDYSISYATGTIMQIVSIKYTPDYVDLEITSKPVPVNNRIEDIYRNLEDYINKDNPSVPTS